MLARLKSGGAPGRRAWRVECSRRVGRPAWAPARDDSLPGPGPSSLATAAASLRASPRRRSGAPSPASAAPALLVSAVSAASSSARLVQPAAGPSCCSAVSVVVVVGGGTFLLAAPYRSSVLGRQRPLPPTAAVQGPCAGAAVASREAPPAPGPGAPSGRPSATLSTSLRRRMHRPRSKARAEALAADAPVGEEPEGQDGRAAARAGDAPASAREADGQPAGSAATATATATAAEGQSAGNWAPQATATATAGEPSAAAATEPAESAHLDPPSRHVKSILDIAAAANGCGGTTSITAAVARRSSHAGGGGGGGGGVRQAGDLSPNRLADGRQVVYVKYDTHASGAASALSHALGYDQRAVVRFDGGAGGLKGMRVLTLANIFMGGFARALSFVVDVRQVAYGPPTPWEERPQTGDVSYTYRVMTRARAREAHDEELPAAIRRARFLLDLSINVRQAWGEKGDVDEEQAYDLADTLYGALLAQQAEQDAAEQRGLDPESQRSDPGEDGDHPDRFGARQQQQQRRRRRQPTGGAASAPPPGIFITADLAQGLTMLTALGLLQKRLREERQQAVVEGTLYRASVAAPRLDGKDGWVFAVRLGFEAPYLAAAQRGERRWTPKWPRSPSPSPSPSSSSSSPSFPSSPSPHSPSSPSWSSSSSAALPPAPAAAAASQLASAGGRRPGEVAAAAPPAAHLPAASGERYAPASHPSPPPPIYMGLTSHTHT